MAIGVIRVPLDTTLLDKDEQYKTVGSGSSLGDAVTSTFQGNGVALKPFSPTFIRATKDDVTNDFTITWLRRSRLGQTLQSGKDVALNEAVEDYEVDILNAPGGTVVRTISVSTQHCVYRGADQIVDLGAITDTISCVIYQISEVVGRGYGAAATLTVATETVAGDPSHLPFIHFTNEDEHPMMIALKDGLLVYARHGRQGGATVAGFYEFDLNQSPQMHRFLSTNYDGRNGFSGDYRPPFWPWPVQQNMVTGGLFPVTFGNSDEAWAMFLRNQVIGDSSGARGRYMISFDPNSSPEDFHIAPIAGNPAVSNAGFCNLLLRHGTTLYAIIGGSPSTAVHSVDNGHTWIGSTNCTGDKTTDFTGKLFSFGGSTWLWDTVSFYENAGNDLVNWEKHAGFTVGGGGIVFGDSVGASQAEFTDLACDGTGIVMMTRWTQQSDGILHNVIFHSSDGDTFTTVRDEVASTDHPVSPIGQYDFTAVVVFGGGFIAYGHEDFSGAFPQAIISTDHGVTWSGFQQVTLEHGGNVNFAAVLSDGTFCVSLGSHGSSTDDFAARMRVSTDGLAFTFLPGEDVS